MNSDEAPYDLMVLYRGPLDSCNYSCGYCPFAKRKESLDDKRKDERALGRFVESVERLPFTSVGVFFTPWGEALVRKRYQQAMVDLASMAHVHKVAIQTNLATPPTWMAHLDEALKAKLAFWSTFHPGETSVDAFVGQVRAYVANGCRLSVGGVALDEHKDAIADLAAQLPREVPLWVNAAKRVHGPYTDVDASWWTALDPTFPTNAVHHESLGHLCRAGQDVISVDGEGNVRRCHFVDEVLGNFHTDDVSALLQARACPNATCGCHIGYVHLERLGLRVLYGEGLLERRRRLPVAQ